MTSCEPATTLTPHSDGIAMLNVWRASTSRSSLLRPLPGDTREGEPPPTCIAIGSSAPLITSRMSRSADSGVSAATAWRPCGYVSLMRSPIGTTSSSPSSTGMLRHCSALRACTSARSLASASSRDMMPSDGPKARASGVVSSGRSSVSTSKIMCTPSKGPPKTTYHA